MKENLEKIIENNRIYVKDGAVADYIPALAKADINDIGLCIASEGGVICSGDFDTQFTIQSISKVFTLALALIDNGSEYVFSKVGFKATDEAFNTMYKLALPGNNYPANSMINSGAILTTSLVKKTDLDPIDRIINFMKILSKRENITIDEEVYLSEKETGDRNKSMAYLMKANGTFGENDDVENILDTYFKQCSILVTAQDIANMGYFIANGCLGLEDYGKTSSQELTRILMSEMLGCGMYNYSTEYSARVGIPSKSGVGGGILGSAPRKYGIGVYSPGLDENGNSRVGIELMEDISNEYKLNILL